MNRLICLIAVTLKFRVGEDLVVITMKGDSILPRSLELEYF